MPNLFVQTSDMIPFAWISDDLGKNLKFQVDAVLLPLAHEHGHARPQSAEDTAVYFQLHSSSKCDRVSKLQKESDFNEVQIRPNFHQDFKRKIG